MHRWYNGKTGRLGSRTLHFASVSVVRLFANLALGLSHTTTISTKLININLIYLLIYVTHLYSDGQTMVRLGDLGVQLYILHQCQFSVSGQGICKLGFGSKSYN